MNYLQSTSLSSEVCWGIQIGTVLLFTWIAILLLDKICHYIWAIIDDAEQTPCTIINFLLTNVWKYKYAPDDHRIHEYIHVSGDYTTDGTNVVFSVALYSFIIPFVLSILITFGTITVYVSTVIALIYIARYVRRLYKTVQTHIKNINIHNDDNI